MTDYHVPDIVPEPEDNEPTEAEKPKTVSDAWVLVILELAYIFRAIRELFKVKSIAMISLTFTMIWLVVHGLGIPEQFDKILNMAFVSYFCYQGFKTTTK